MAQEQVPPKNKPAAAKPIRKLICTDEDTLGTRLGGHRSCRYADDEAAARTETRMEIERRQQELGQHGFEPTHGR